MRVVQFGQISDENRKMSEVPLGAADPHPESSNPRETLRASVLGNGPDGLCPRPSITQAVDDACDLFEAAWIGNSVPAIEDYLRRVPVTDQPDLLCELVRLDVDYRQRREERPELAEYLVRFPTHASQLELALESDAELWSPGSASGGVEPVPRSSKTSRETLDPGDSDQATVPSIPESMQSIAHFRILTLIGSGGFGTVWKAHDPRLERIVAIKVPRKDQLSETELERFLNEARSAAGLRHPHIVTVHDVSHDPALPYIVNEYVDGVSLRDWLSIRKMSIAEAVLFCARLARALEHAHERQIVHRDIKPENILVDARLEPHLADFGLAKHGGRVLPVAEVESGANASTLSGSDAELGKAPKPATLGIREGAVFGTAPYMSPEQARGEGVHATPASDIYSLGVVLYELLAGRVPFNGATLRILIHQVQFETPPLLSQINPDIPRSLETICLKALSKRPAARHATASEFAAELEQFLHEKPCKPQPTGRFQQALAWGRRHWLATGGMALVMLAAAVCAAAFLFTATLTGKGVRVLIRTLPEGAKVVLVPLRSSDGAPDPSRMLRPSQKTPFEIDLTESDYLVVAEIENHGFHEVYRHVPASNAEIPQAYLHRYFQRTERGTVLWREIRIPDQSVVNEMALVPAVAQSARHSARDRQVNSKPFYLDITEFSVGDYRRVHQGELPLSLRKSSTGDQMPHTRVSYDEAVELAEAAGKRLPEAAELAQASTSGGARKFPWGDVWDERASISQSPGEVGSPDFDRMMVVEPAIRNLYSNVFEWTTSQVADPAGPLDGTGDGIRWTVSAPRRIVWPCEVKFVGGKWMPVDPARERLTPITEDQHARKPNLGFRCARSQRPRMDPENW